MAQKKRGTRASIIERNIFATRKRHAGTRGMDAAAACGTSAARGARLLALLRRASRIARHTLAATPRASAPAATAHSAHAHLPYMRALSLMGA